VAGALRSRTIESHELGDEVGDKVGSEDLSAEQLEPQPGLVSPNPNSKFQTLQVLGSRSVMKIENAMLRIARHLKLGVDHGGVTGYTRDLLLPIT